MSIIYAKIITKTKFFDKQYIKKNIELLKVGKSKIYLKKWTFEENLKKPTIIQNKKGDYTSQR